MAMTKTVSDWNGSSLSDHLKGSLLIAEISHCRIPSRMISPKNECGQLFEDQLVK